MKRRYLVFGLSVVLALALAVPALGGPSNPIASASKSVKSIAQTALKRANQAKKQAKTALNKANEAQSSANGAQKSANGAQNTADSAKTAAAAAQSTADSAVAAAATAQAAAEAAQATANSKISGSSFHEGSSVSGASESALAASGCETGEEPSGGGFVITGAQSDRVRVDLSSQYLNGWIVSADNISGLAGGSWSLTAVAICIN